MNHDFLLGPLDTDSISICKSDMSPFILEEENNLIKELNSLFPEKINWTHDGLFSCVVVLRTKNYVLWDEKSLKIKGSALKSAKLEKALKQFQTDIIWEIINNTCKYQEVYNKYAKEAMDIKDISRWASKKSISEKVLSSERTNESKIRDAIENTEYSEGDKIHVFFLEDKSLQLVEKFDGNYDKMKMLKRLHDTSSIFENVLNCKELFPNYSLKKNKKLLENVK